MSELTAHRLNKLSWKIPFVKSVPRFINDTHFYDPTFHQIDRSCILWGYWISHKYLEGYESAIRSIFKLKDIGKLSRHFDMINDDTVSIHVRRGDYVNRPGTHPVVTSKYLNEAMEVFEGKNFLVFSDDMEWCKSNIGGRNVRYAEGGTEIEDMALISCCPHNIIANSTFSWWGAWLNENPGKRVVAPIEWFGPELPYRETREFLPDDWIRL